LSLDEIAASKCTPVAEEMKKNQRETFLKPKKRKKEN